MESDATSGQRTSSLRILVVDDNQDAARSLAMLLQLRGNDTRIAHDGEEALALAADFLPDAVLLDLSLPGISGYDVARQIRSQPWGTDAVLIAVTGWDRESDKTLASEAGFNHFVLKPVDLAELMKLLSSVQRRTDR